MRRCMRGCMVLMVGGSACGSIGMALRDLGSSLFVCSAGCSLALARAWVGGPRGSMVGLLHVAWGWRLCGLVVGGDCGRVATSFAGCSWASWLCGRCVVLGWRGGREVWLGGELVGAYQLAPGVGECGSVGRG